jgi:hypothetical protein
MRSTKLVTTLMGVAVAAAIAAPTAFAMPIDPVGSPTTAHDASDVPPPPSSIAASAGEDYEALRAPGGTGEGTVVAVEKPSAPAGFDWVSAAIGAVAAAGIALVSLAAIGTRRRAVSASVR